MEVKNFTKETPFGNEERLNINAVNLILEILIKKTSLKDVINFLFITEKEEKFLDENKEINKVKKTINFLLKEVGYFNLLGCLLKLPDKIPEENNIITIPISHQNDSSSTKNTSFNCKGTTMPSSLTEVTENENITNSYEENNIIINISESEDNEQTHKYEEKENIINLNENGITQYIIHKGKKSEQKRYPKKKIVNDEENKNDIYKRINSETKVVNNNTKLRLSKSDRKQLTYHFSRGEDYFYKYKLIGLKRGVGTFCCADNNCKSMGFYSLDDKFFTLESCHNIPSNKHSYNQIMDSKDYNYLDYMTNNQIEELQVLKDPE